MSFAIILVVTSKDSYEPDDDESVFKLRKDSGEKSSHSLPRA